ncbi:MAG TPA: hypothetical protein PLP94_02735 [Candidatus Saccharicenans sp.]|jgi:hypothetical protein|nr:hypothetical protein [Candidatus Saccharicenans sp.]HOJ26102.1 hypothetical protein [Candidatus Saccharicenans sp.]HOL45298.1 hypothetical protein [Candidatus Saccharicenans sp.]HOM94036.1 hypothetical protein [Candidatus Saccharicenans sp.]HOT68988.1 hypothetical protein [Candidatus Saccharicenans sp.]
MEEKESAELFEKSLKRIPVETIALGCLASILGLIFFDLISAALLVAGALVAAAGFISLRSFVNRYVFREKTVFRKRALILYSLRLLLICLVFLAIIFIFRGKVIAFVAGFSSLVVAVLIEAIRNLVNIRQWKA